MMTNLWIYEGALDGDVLTLESEGPSMKGDGALGKYRDIIEFKDVGPPRATPHISQPLTEPQIAGQATGQGRAFYR